VFWIWDTGISPVFARMIQTEMTEGLSGIAVLPDIGSTAMKYLLQHVYSGELIPLKGMDNESILELINASDKVSHHRQFNDITHLTCEIFISPPALYFSIN
jgi:transcriptional regulatory protein LevR